MKLNRHGKVNVPFTHGGDQRPNAYKTSFGFDCGHNFFEYITHTPTHTQLAIITVR